MYKFFPSSLFLAYLFATVYSACSNVNPESLIPKSSKYEGKISKILEVILTKIPYFGEILYRGGEMDMLRIMSEVNQGIYDRELLENVKRACLIGIKRSNGLMTEAMGNFKKLQEEKKESNFNAEFIVIVQKSEELKMMFNSYMKLGFLYIFIDVCEFIKSLKTVLPNNYPLLRVDFLYQMQFLDPNDPSSLPNCARSWTRNVQELWEVYPVAHSAIQLYGKSCLKLVYFSEKENQKGGEFLNVSEPSYKASLERNGILKKFFEQELFGIHVKEPTEDWVMVTRNI